MQININLDRDFETCLSSLRAQYGEEFEYLNGIHPSQLDYSAFLNKFSQLFFVIFEMNFSIINYK